MSSILGVIGREPLELFALELKNCNISYFVYTLASTNINQSAPNMVKIYLTTRSWISSILDLIGQEQPELFALELKKNAIFDFVYSQASTFFNQSALNLAKIYITIRSWMNSILGVIGPEPPELFALDLKNCKISYFVYTLASTNINQSAPKVVKLYMTIRSWISSILDLIGLAVFDFVYSLASTIFNQSALNLAKICMTTRSWISLIIVLTGLERLELFALELKKKKNAGFDCVYTLASTIINRWAPNLAKLYMTIRFRLSSIMPVIGLERLQLFALELENLLYLTLFTL